MNGIHKGEQKRLSVCLSIHQPVCVRLRVGAVRLKQNSPISICLSVMTLNIYIYFNSSNSQNITTYLYLLMLSLSFHHLFRKLSVIFLP